MYPLKLLFGKFLKKFSRNFKLFLENFNPPALRNQHGF